MALTFLSPQFLWLLAALPLVVALHFLRSRRTEYDVSALFLWERARQVVAKRRRFSPTWLLLAQLLFTALAAIVLARPALISNTEPDRVLIIDASASMTARNGPGEDSGTRLAAAVAEATGLTSGSGRLALIRAGSEATLLLPLEAADVDRSAALTSLQAGDATADIGGALELAAGLLPAAEVHLFSDQQFDLGQTNVHLVGEPVANIGISALDIGIGQVFVGVVSSSDGPVETGVALFRDGQPLVSGSVLVPANGAGSITFPLQEQGGIIEARLEPRGTDALALDDVAFAGSRPVAVVTDDGHGALTRALAAVPNTSVRYSVGARLLEADLKVLTRGAVGGDEPGNYLVVAPPVAEPRFAVVSDWDRAHPLLRFVDLSELVVGLAADGPGWEPGAGWRVLARASDLTPVMRVRDDGAVFEVQLAFHPSQSDITLRPAFPALVANVVDRIRTTSRVRLGEAPPGNAGDAVSALGSATLLRPGAYRILETGLQELDGAAAGSGAGSADGPGEAADPTGAAPVLLASLLAAGESRLPTSGELLLSARGPVAEPGSAAPPPAGEAGALAAADERVEAGGAREPAGGAPTTIGVVLLVLALLALLVEWALYSGGLNTLAGSLASRFGVRSRSAN